MKTKLLLVLLVCAAIGGAHAIAQPPQSKAQALLRKFDKEKQRVSPALRAVSMQVPDSTVSFDGNGIPMECVEYSVKGNVITEVNYMAMDGWVKYSKVISEHNGNMIPLRVEFFDWKNGDWVPESRSTYTYDAQGRSLTQLDERYNTTASAMVNDEKTEYTYEDSPSRRTGVVYAWSGGVWKETERLVDTYNSDGKPMLSEAYEKGVLVDNLLYEYDGSGNLTRLEESTLNHTTQVLEKNYQLVSKYNSSNEEIETVASEWMEGVWEESGKNTYAYNSNGTIAREEVYAFNIGGTNEWDLLAYKIYYYSGSTHVDQASSNAPTIYAARGMIVIENSTEGAEITVTGLSGVVSHRIKATSGRMEIAAVPGVYILQVGKTARKVMVK